ncbi:MAG: hypothetical protein Q7T18_03110, partial [Sedimentisphaerales bacterium]|nr:hypothetical protein [Sedimentisphaerales bacterium]
MSKYRKYQGLMAGVQAVCANAEARSHACAFMHIWWAHQHLSRCFYLGDTELRAICMQLQSQKNMTISENKMHLSKKDMRLSRCTAAVLLAFSGGTINLANAQT